MKKISIKIISIAILFSMIFSLSACGLDYDGEFIRADIFYLLDDKGSNYLFYSHEEIEEFLLDTKDVIKTGLGEYQEQYLEKVTELFEKYDEDFFETNLLVLVGLVETSGSIRHEIKTFSVLGDTITIQIKRKSPNICTADMAYWHLFLTVSKSDFSGNKVQVNIK